MVRRPGWFTFGVLNKQNIVRKIVAHLAAESARYAQAARVAHSEATDDQSKAENKYDTRGLEAAYLARGQSRQATEVLQAIQSYQELPLRAFEKGEPIGVGALVELERRGERTVYFVGPQAGGIEIEEGGREIMVITPQSPLGQQLVGHTQGERFKIQIGPGSDPCHVFGVS